MKRVLLGLIGLMSMALPLHSASAWSHSGYYGTASGGGGSWSAHGYRGGSASGGGGSWSGHTAYGGTASGGGGSWSAHGASGGYASGGGGSWSAHGAYGGSAYGGYDHYGGSYYGAYHPPTTVNYYGSGCYNCGGWNAGAAAATGLAVGAVVGAAAASANTSAATANAYSAGVAAGTTAATQPAYIMNDVYAVLPGGCAYKPFAGAAYYQCGLTWFEPSYGANGLFYRVVPTP